MWHQICVDLLGKQLILQISQHQLEVWWFHWILTLRTQSLCHTPGWGLGAQIHKTDPNLRIPIASPCPPKFFWLTSCQLGGWVSGPHSWIRQFARIAHRTWEDAWHMATVLLWWIQLRKSSMEGMHRRRDKWWWCSEVPRPFWAGHPPGFPMCSPVQKRYKSCCLEAFSKVPLESAIDLSHWPLVIGLLSSHSSLAGGWGAGQQVPTL